MPQLSNSHANIQIVMKNLIHKQHSIITRVRTWINADIHVRDVKNYIRIGLIWKIINVPYKNSHHIIAN